MPQALHGIKVEINVNNTLLLTDPLAFGLQFMPFFPQDLKLFLKINAHRAKPLRWCLLRFCGQFRCGVLIKQFLPLGA
jgi:hypothetical protein